MELPASVTSELDALAISFGRPLVLNVTIDDSFKDPIWKRDRYGEVCMVIRRPNAKLLLSIKTFYPRGAYRLPTGGIHHGESVLDALVREAYEETGLELAVRRFLSRIAYAPASRPQAPPVFHTFAFLLEELGGTLGALDQTERIEDWREVDVRELPGVAERLAHLRTQGTEDIGGDWRAWGEFRAVVHRAVHDALLAA